MHVALRRSIAATLLTSIAACVQAPRAIAPPQALSSGWTLTDAASVRDPAQVVSQPGYMPAGWHNAIVPGTVLTSLVADGTYPEPLYGENNRPDRIPESLARAQYWYRTEFTPPPTTPDRHLWLVLNGINYTAQIWVNGHHAGDIHGAFSRGRFDISPFVTAGKPAAVAVLISPPPHPGNPQEQTVQNGTGPNGGILAEDGPTFIASIGWDWMPAIRDRNVGIWQDVHLESTGPVTIADPLVTSALPLPRTDAAELTVSATLTNITDKPESGTLAGTIESTHFARRITLAPHQSLLVTFSPSDTPALHFDHPRLWWPNTYGDPNLYKLHLEFTANNTLSASKDLSFGIRQITYDVPGSDNLTLSCNGVPIICKGGDWGMDEAMKRSPRDRLDAQIRMHQQANYTMIRNWVGQSTQEDFYDLCDRYGILVWDELFQPNPSDGPNPLDVPLYLANVREKVLRFRSHPCIALWCGRNEGDPPPNLDPGIRAIFNELDPTRRYQKNSNDGKGVRSGGPYYWRAPRAYYQYPDTEPFKTELGSVSIPTLQAIQHMMPEKDWWPLNNDDFAEHDLLRGAQQGNTYPQTLITRYGPQKSLSDFVRQGQLANYEAYRAMYEGRFAKLFHPVTGVLTWMSNPAQPSMVWQLYSHDLEPNASLFATRKACEPLHVMLNQATDHLQIINTRPVPAPALHLRARIFNLDGSLAADTTRIADAAPLSATDTGMVDFPDTLSTVHFIKLELLDAHNNLVSDNFYWRTSHIIQPPTQPATTSAPARGARGRQQPPPQEDFTDLQNLPPTTVRAALRFSGDTLTATLTNTGKSIALLTHVQLQNPVTHERILPVFYSDNYISLLPGESRTLTLTSPSPAFHPGSVSLPPSLVIDGYNVNLP